MGRERKSTKTAQEIMAYHMRNHTQPLLDRIFEYRLLEAVKRDKAKEEMLQATQRKQAEAAQRKQAEAAQRKQTEAAQRKQAEEAQQKLILKMHTILSVSDEQIAEMLEVDIEKVKKVLSAAR